MLHKLQRHEGDPHSLWGCSGEYCTSSVLYKNITSRDAKLSTKPSRVTVANTPIVSSTYIDKLPGTRYEAHLYIHDISGGKWAALFRRVANFTQPRASKNAEEGPQYGAAYFISIIWYSMLVGGGGQGELGGEAGVREPS